MSSIYSCTGSACDVKTSIMYYRPSLAANSCFLALFALSGLIHLGQGIYTRKPYFTSAMILGCIAECIGYGGRIMSSNNPWSLNGFLVGICCLALAPAFFAGAIYFTLGDVVRHVSVQASRIKPRTYAILFISSDAIALILQGTGGGLASVASQTAGGNVQPGTDAMVAGLAFQAASMSVFICIALEYIWRARKMQKAGAIQLSWPVSKTRFALFLGFFCLAIVTIFTRTIYRVIELAGGWTSHLYRTQTDFIILEGVMVLVAVYALHIGHPGNLGKGKIAPKELQKGDDGQEKVLEE